MSLTLNCNTLTSSNGISVGSSSSTLSTYEEFAFTTSWSYGAGTVWSGQHILVKTGNIVTLRLGAYNPTTLPSGNATLQGGPLPARFCPPSPGFFGTTCAYYNGANTVLYIQVTPSGTIYLGTGGNAVSNLNGGASFNLYGSSITYLTI